MATSHGRAMAAVLACGDGAALSHRTAGTLWELVRPRREAGLIDVSAPRTVRGPSHGVRLHRVSRLDPDQVVSKFGLPLTSISRTLVDLAATVELAELEQALARAERRDTLTRGDIESQLTQQPGRPGNGVLAALLALTSGPSLTRSEAEALLLSLLRKGDLPRPETNAIIEGFEVDFLWRGQRLVVEIDGYVYHRGRNAFESDRQRDAKLTAAGLRVMRVTWRQLTQKPEAVLARVVRALVVGVPQTQPQSPGT
ncbi:MAG: endonuclease domain-containing protein [Longimicrobiales bacterium]